MSLSTQERILVHQVHPVKLAADVSASVISNTLLWRHRPLSGLAVRYLLPPIGSLVVLRFVDVEQLALSAAGQYVLKHMPPSMVVLRLAGDTLMAIGAWKHRPAWMIVGVLLVVFGWSHGFIETAARAARRG